MTKRQAPKLITGPGIVLILGCNGLIIFVFVVGALFIGLWLDQQMGWNGPALIGLIVVSIPICLLIVTRMTLAMVRWLTPPDD